MSKEKLKCPKCGSDYLEPEQLTLTDRIIAFISNDVIRHFRCLNCLWEGRAHVAKSHPKHHPQA